MRDLGTPVYSPRLFEEVLDGISGSRAPARRPAGPQAGRGRSDVSDRAARRSAVGVVDPRLQQPLSEPSAVLERDRGSRARAAATRSISGGRRRTKAPTSSRNSGARSRCRCTGNTCSTDGHDAARTSDRRIPKFHLMIEAWKKLPLKVATDARSPHRSRDSIESDRA